MTSEKRIVEKEIYIAYNGKEFDNDVICLKYEKQAQALENIKCRVNSTDEITPLMQHCVWDEEEESFLALSSFESLGYFYATTDYEKDLVNYLTDCIGFCSMPYQSFDFDLAKYNTITEEFEND